MLAHLRPGLFVHIEKMQIVEQTGVGSGNLFACRFSSRQFRDGLADGADAEFGLRVVEMKRRRAARDIQEAPDLPSGLPLRRPFEALQFARR